MKRLEVEKIKPGMILGEDVISKKGQVLATSGQRLTAQQLLHMSFYGLSKLYVEECDESYEDLQDLVAPDDFIGKTSSWKLINSVEYEVFKKAYENCTIKLEQVVNNFVRQQMPLDNEELLDDIREVFHRNTTGLGVMAMLLHMQGIDTSTYAHSVNVAIICRVFGGWLGITDRHELDVLTMCGLYHDIGKALVPNNILTKPEKLDANEYERMCEHPVLGYEILKTEEIDRRIKNAALQHHERGDGSGYPYGLLRDFTAPFSRIVAIADVYDAMTADRCYREGICPFEVIAQFQRERAGRYDPEYLPVFLEHIAQAYIGCGALLSDGTRGIISMINNNALSSPLIKLEDESFVNLESRTDLYIRACV